MHAPSTGLEAEHEAPRCTSLGRTLVDDKEFAQRRAAGRHAYSKSKGMGALRRICAEILPPETARPTKDLRAAGLKGVVEHRLADTLKRHVGARWGLTKSRRAGHEAYTTESQTLDIAAARDSVDTAGVDYTSSKNSASRSTLVDSTHSGGTENGLDSVLSLGQHTVSVPSRDRSWAQSDSCTLPIRDRSWARLDISAVPSRERLDSAVHVGDCGAGLRHGTGRVAPHVISGPVAGGEHELDRTAGRRFALRRNAHFSDVLEAVNCQTARVAYRRIVQRGKRWCSSFHGVSAAAPAPSHRLACVTLDHVGLGLLSLGGATSSFHVDRCDAGRPQSIRSGASFAPPSLGGASPCVQRVGAWQVPGAWKANPLWEISSPQPGVFPLHCRDARGALDPVPLTPMVCDRHQFCYRFYLAGTKMRWQARRQGRTTTELQCFVRSSVVALVLFAGHAAGIRSANQSSDYPPSISHASVVILPAAFAKLPAIDSAIVESFVLFTGIEVFQCFLYTL
ncbi:hypothetical protein H4R20_004621 [Coemansia guatemalensis]|uniref:Uncharacterized protein n=1 Tax=Coemansia guatemalensis TaxID=2761395 RepID=A0A9W8HTC7_9FUNG|nr:hypothetical protein H4R20_004621 [Coemansia guatemalensis]